MIIHSLSLESFRNFASLHVAFGPQVNIFYGTNGSGKTNLLEAVFVLCLGRSQRGASDAILLAEGADYYRLEGQIEHTLKPRTVAVAYERHGRKKISLDSIPVKLSELYEYFCAVAAGPEDARILSGAPTVRRTFMDLYLSQLSSSYLHNLSVYYKALTQKNAALRNGMDPSPFDTILVGAGSRIMAARIEFIAALSDSAARHYQTVAGNEMLHMAYRPSVRIDQSHTTTDEIETSFQVSLEDMFEREQIMRTALIGPHRDDILFEIAGYPARTHGSQGQLRTAAIALKLAVFELLKERRGVAPLLLLDEVFAELDGSRTDALVQLFSEFGQVFLTTAVDPPEGLRGQAWQFRIENGTLREAG